MHTLEQEDAFSGVVRITRGTAELFAGAYAFASRSWKICNTLEMRFDTASITKLFTAVAILQLIDSNQLTFDTPVTDFLGLQDTAISAGVNVYHLLTHSSGIGDDADEEAGESYEALWETRPNYSVVETKDFLPQFVYKPANFAAGQGCRYCNCGYILLGLMIEKASGMCYRDYVRQQIFARTGMNHSDFLHKAQTHESASCTSCSWPMPLVYDPAGEGTKTSSGRTLAMPGPLRLETVFCANLRLDEWHVRMKV